MNQFGKLAKHNDHKDFLETMWTGQVETNEKSPRELLDIWMDFLGHKCSVENTNIIQLENKKKRKKKEKIREMCGMSMQT